MRFFLNSSERSYLRGLEAEFGESTNAIRLELNRFEAAGLLVSDMEKNRKMYQANQQHPLFDDINSIVKKSMRLDHLVDHVVRKLGNVKRAYITGNTAKGLKDNEINCILVGENIDENYLKSLINKAEKLIKRTIQCLVLPPTKEKEYLVEFPEALLVWKER